MQLSSGDTDFSVDLFLKWLWSFQTVVFAVSLCLYAVLGLSLEGVAMSSPLRGLSARPGDVPQGGAPGRKKLSKAQSKRQFRKGAVKHAAINYAPSPMRGGIRL